MTLTGSATKADWQTALRSVTYNNTSDNPDTGNRTLNFAVNDGTYNSNTAAKTVSVTAVNDAPGAGGEWWHDRPHRERAGGGRLGHHGHRRRQREPGRRARDRRCRVHRRPGRARLHHPERHHRFLERADDDADRQRHQGGLANRAAVGQLQQHQRHDPDTGNRTLNFVVNDGTLDSNTAAKTVSVTAVNDAPVNSVPGPQTTGTGAPLVFSTGNGNLVSISEPTPHPARCRSSWSAPTERRRCPAPMA